MTGETTRLTFHAPEELDVVLDDYAHENHCSKSEVIRELLWVGVEESDVKDVLPEEVVVLAERKRFLNREGKLRNLRTGFRTQVKSAFMNRFKNGYNPEELRGWAENMRHDAHIQFQGEEHAERRQEVLQYIDDVLENAVEAYEASDHDPLEPSELFESFSGVEEGRRVREAERDLDELVEEASDMLTDDVGGFLGEKATDADAVEEILAERSDVPDGVASEVVEKAKQRVGHPDANGGDSA